MCFSFDMRKRIEKNNFGQALTESVMLCLVYFIKHTEHSTNQQNPRTFHSDPASQVVLIPRTLLAYHWLACQLTILRTYSFDRLCAINLAKSSSDSTSLFAIGVSCRAFLTCETVFATLSSLYQFSLISFGLVYTLLTSKFQLWWIKAMYIKDGDGWTFVLTFANTAQC